MPVNPFEQLPPVQVVDEDFHAGLVRLKENYQQATGVYPMNAHPESFLLEQFAYESNLLRQLINDESRQNLLAYARNGRLDHLGELLDTPRLKAQAARTILQFTLDSHSAPITIPANTQVRAADDKTLFSTLEAQTAQAGVGMLAITAQCTTAGITGNGFNPGEVAGLVGGAPYVVAVSNTNVTSGGADIEDDERYRYRIHLAPSKFSTAGSEDSYIYHTLSAHQNIADTKAWTPDDEPGNAYICALLKAGGLPDAAMKELILQTLSAKKVRPMTDNVTLVQPEAVPFGIDMVLQVHASHSALVNSTHLEALSRLTTLTDGWRGKLGRDIVPEEAVERCQKLPGVYRAQVNTPGHQALDRHQFPDCTDLQISVEIVQEAQ